MNATLVLNSPDMIFSVDILGTPQTASASERTANQLARVDLQSTSGYLHKPGQASGSLRDQKSYDEQSD